MELDEVLSAAKRWLGGVPEVVDFLGDAITTILGLAALYGLLFRRKELSDVLRALFRADLITNVHRIKETLGLLDSLNYDAKEDRREINALIGQLCGQLEAVVPSSGELEEVHAHLKQLVDGNARLSESKKRRLVQQIHVHLDRTHITPELVKPIKGKE